MFPDARGHAGGVQIIPSLDADGRPLSDHDLITCCIEGLHQAFRTDEDKKTVPVIGAALICVWPDVVPQIARAYTNGLLV